MYTFYIYSIFSIISALIKKSRFLLHFLNGNIPSMPAEEFGENVDYLLWIVIKMSLMLTMITTNELDFSLQQPRLSLLLFNLSAPVSLCA